MECGKKNEPVQSENFYEYFSLTALIHHVSEI